MVSIFERLMITPERGQTSGKTFALDSQEIEILNSIKAMGLIKNPITMRREDATTPKIEGELNTDVLERMHPSQIAKLHNSLKDVNLSNEGENGSAFEKTKAGLKKLLAKKTLEDVFKSSDALEKDADRIQKSLNTLGHDVGKVDGVFGESTARGLAGYINKEGISARALPADVKKKLDEEGFKLDTETSIVPGGKWTKESLKQAVTNILGADKLSKDDFRTLQGFLVERGYKPGLQDGVFGPKSQKAFVQFLEENTEYHSKIGPNLKVKTAIYAIDNEVSDKLKKSLDLPDYSNLPAPTDKERISYYKQFFTERGIDPKLADGIEAASKLTGVPPQNLFAAIGQESNFGQYKVVRPGEKGYSTASGMENNPTQFTNGTFKVMNEKYGVQAQRELASVGIDLKPGQDWRTNALVSPYMMATYMKESGSTTDLKEQYISHFLPGLLKAKDGDAIAAHKFRSAAYANSSIFYDDGKAATITRTRDKVFGKLREEIDLEKKVVLAGRVEKLIADLKGEAPPKNPYRDDRLRHREADEFAEAVDIKKGPRRDPQIAGAEIRLNNNFKGASAPLIEIADMPPPKPKGPDLSGPAPNLFG